MPATLLITLDAISRDRGAGVEKGVLPLRVVTPLSAPTLLMPLVFMSSVRTAEMVDAEFSVRLPAVAVTPEQFVMPFAPMSRGVVTYRVVVGEMVMDDPDRMPDALVML